MTIEITYKERWKKEHPELEKIKTCSKCLEDRIKNYVEYGLDNCKDVRNQYMRYLLTVCEIKNFKDKLLEAIRIDYACDGELRVKVKEKCKRKFCEVDDFLHIQNPKTIAGGVIYYISVLWDNKFIFHNTRSNYCVTYFTQRDIASCLGITEVTIRDAFHVLNHKYNELI